MERSGLAALVDLAEESGMLPLESALEGRVTEECLSLYNADGSMRKTMKSKLLDQFNLDPVAQEPDNYVGIVDMGMIWRLATPTPEDREAKKRDGSKCCWKNYLENICKIIFSRHANASPYIILINDKYDLPFSIKNDKHDRRAAKHAHIPNVFPKPTDTFPEAAEFNQLMLRSGNKIRLQKLLRGQLKAQAPMMGCGIIYCEGGTSTNVSTGVANTDFIFRHPEADTMMFSAYAKLRTGMFNGVVVLDIDDMIQMCTFKQHISHNNSLVIYLSNARRSLSTAVTCYQKSHRSSFLSM